MRPLAAYLVAPAIVPLAAFLHSAFFARPPCPNCAIPNWAYALPAAFFTYPAALIIATPTLRLLPTRLRSPFIGPPLAGAALALVVFLLFTYGMTGGIPQRLGLAMLAAVLGALSATTYAILLGAHHPIWRSSPRYAIRDYLPFFCLFLAVEGGAYFGLFSCGGYVVVRETFDLVFLVSVASVTFYGQGVLSSVPRRIAFFVGTLALFAAALAASSAFYPGPPASVAEFIQSFLKGLSDGSC
jgi:hypothetical protein